MGEGQVGVINGVFSQLRGGIGWGWISGFFPLPFLPASAELVAGSRQGRGDLGVFKMLEENSQTQRCKNVKLS